MGVVLKDPAERTVAEQLEAERTLRLLRGGRIEQQHRRRLALSEWRDALEAGIVQRADRNAWVLARMEELANPRETEAYRQLLEMLAQTARQDAVYAVRLPVLTAAREETKDSDITSWQQQAVRSRLEGIANKDELARRALDDAGIRDRLARLVQTYAAKAWRIVTDAWPRLEEEAKASQGNDEFPYERLRDEATRAVESPFGPVPWPDAEFAKRLREIGATGEALAERVLKTSADRLAKLDLPASAGDPFPWTGTREARSEWWTREGREALHDKPREWGAAVWGLWLHEESHPRIYDYLARALWEDVVRPLVKREARNPPSLVIEVHEDVTRVHSRVVRVEESNGQRALVFAGADRFLLVPSVAEELAQALVERGVGLLGTVTAHRALRYQITAAHERAIRGEPDARVLAIDGGWSGYAELLGLASKAEPEKLKAITYAQDAVHVTLPDGSRERMLNLREWPAQGRRQGRIHLTVGTMLLPHYVFELGLSGRRLREAQRLIPVCGLPPFVGRNRDHGPQATLSMVVVRELRTKARELARDGAVRIPRERWAAMAREAGLPPTLLGRVIDGWTQDGPDAPAFLVRAAADAYTLAPAHARELDLIVAIGRTENRAVAAGERSVRARQAKSRRLGRGEE